MLRRLYHDQPESFAFTDANRAWAEGQISKFPEGRQASAIIPLLWRAQEQEGWLTRPAIEHVADMLGMAYIRALEVASFYFMFQLQPVGSVAHIQVCGTTSCMICGAEDLIGVCREKIAANPHELSDDGKLSWEEVECLGACANAPMAQIGKDYYEDLTAERMGEIIDSLRAGDVPVPGPQQGRYASEPASGLTTLTEFDSGHTQYNASVQRAVDLGDTIRRIDGSEVPLLTSWRDHGANHQPEKPGETSPVVTGKAPATAERKVEKAVKEPPAAKEEPQREVSDEAARKLEKKGMGRPASKSETTDEEKAAQEPARLDKAKAAEKDEDVPAGEDMETDQVTGQKPHTLTAPRGSGPDDLKKIKGVGPKLEAMLHSLGFYHFDQIAQWSEAEKTWVDDHLEGFRGRVRRDNWVEQAKLLAEGKETEFSSRVKKGDVY
ncbi:NADH-quinone oxidoreductase subunit E [Roseovarius sp. SCSIO 43702]|uniref:NADH-quinone oxidoreductase subunit E n=1 Tax=Roseovarius sp. SCSIO 43702 TaxID=2823043 RepID=UPI001C7325AA|nr:NADH-quinone oxidoreductase subunit E [Roseovarius sp. SCSIO 43702]QYX55625.1 NADH-quinone oxidoreductase subunit E [Roseovarius sp. SCSIO 43702]